MSKTEYWESHSHKRKLFKRRYAAWKGGLSGDEPMPTDFRVVKASALLQQVMNHLQIDNKTVDRDRLSQVWQEVVGVENAKQTEPYSIRGRVLTIKVLQPSMRFHYQQIKVSMLKQIQKALPDEKIKELKFIIA